MGLYAILLITKQFLDAALSRFAATTWIGGVVGYLLAGLSSEQFGKITTLWFGLAIGLIAASLVFAIRLRAKVKMKT